MVPFSDLTIKRTRPLWGTFVEIELRGMFGEAFLKRCIAHGFKAVEQIDRLMNGRRPDSELHRLNRQPAGRWIRLHPLLINVLSQANQLHQASEGVFDMRRPGASRKTKTVEPLLFRGSWVCKTGSWELDLSGIVKGFAVDYAVARIRRVAQGKLLGGVVNAGGDLRLWGTMAQWITIRTGDFTSPMDSSFKVAQAAVATRPLQHPKSGRLTQTSFWKSRGVGPFHQPRTVSIFAQDCMLADALTQVVLLGKPEIADRCLALYRARAVVYDKDGKIQGVCG